MLENTQILISGLICGIIFFQTAIIAPSIFKIFSPEDAGPFLRSIFPKLFMLVAALSLIALMLSFISDIKLSQYVFSFSLIFMLICYFIVPMTNQARDDGNDQKFNRLHTISVVLTMLVLVLNLGWLFLI